MATYKPLFDNLLIKPVRSDAATKSGIILPETVDKEKPEKGEVVALGDGKLLENGQRKPFDVQVGDIVIFKKYAPDEVPGEKELFLIKEEEILAVVK